MSLFDLPSHTVSSVTVQFCVTLITSRALPGCRGVGIVLCTTYECCAFTQHMHMCMHMYMHMHMRMYRERF